MLYAFWQSAFISIFSYAVLITGCIIGFIDSVPIVISLLIIVISLMLRIGAIKTAQICYFNSLRLSEKDIDGFIAFQEKLSEKVNIRIKGTIYMNIIVALIQHERTNEAKKRLIAFGNTLNNPDLLTRFNYLSILSLIEITERKFDKTDHFIEQMRDLSEQMVRDPRYNSKIAMDKLETVMDTLMTEAEFFSRTPEMLAGDDRRFAENYLTKIKKAQQRENEKVSGSPYHNYYKYKYDYTIGTIYAISGDIEKAKETMKGPAECGLSYPFVKRAKEYIESGDLKTIWKCGDVSDEPV